MDASHVDVHLVIGLAAVAVLAIVAVTALAPRARVAAPLILVALGIAMSFLPQVPTVEIEPEWILAGVLPPLLYSSAVSLPTMEFRRDFTAIGALSVLLVLLSAVLLGVLFTHLIPGIPLSIGIALGAIVSPTDAVATRIVKRLNASPRVVTVLEGESLLNDASALVLLRSAIAATATAVSMWSIAGSFIWAVVGAVGIGFVVGMLGLAVRARVGNAALSTAVSFVVPFLAYLPAERLDASGLVAVVVTGLVTGNGAAKYLRPQDRFAEESNWRTVELLLEGGLFLLMGLELYGLVEEVHAEHGSVGRAAAVATVAVIAVLAIRALFLWPVLEAQQRRAERGRAVRGQIADLSDRLDRRLDEVAESGETELILEPRPWAQERDGVVPMDEPDHLVGGPVRRAVLGDGPTVVPVERANRWQEILRRRTADIDYITAEPLGWREGALLVWAGMRGAVTVAASQTLPVDTPQRSFLVLVAFAVAGGTLLVQGGTLPWAVRRLGLIGSSGRAEEDLTGVRAELNEAAAELLDHEGLRRRDGDSFDPAVVARVRQDVLRERTSQDEDELAPADAFRQYRELRLRAIAAQRQALLAARSSGVYSSEALGHALDVLDAEQISVEMRRGPVGVPASTGP